MLTLLGISLLLIVGSTHTNALNSIYERIESLVTENSQPEISALGAQAERIIEKLNASYAISARADRAQSAHEAAVCQAEKTPQMMRINRTIYETLGEQYQLSPRNTQQAYKLSQKVRQLKEERHRILRRMAHYQGTGKQISACDGPCAAQRIILNTHLMETIMRLIDSIEASPHAAEFQQLLNAARVLEYEKLTTCDLAHNRLHERLGHALAQHYH